MAVVDIEIRFRDVSDGYDTLKGIPGSNNGKCNNISLVHHGPGFFQGHIPGNSGGLPVLDIRYLCFNGCYESRLLNLEMIKNKLSLS